MMMTMTFIYVSMYLAASYKPNVHPGTLKNVLKPNIWMFYTKDAEWNTCREFGNAA